MEDAALIAETLRNPEAYRAIIEKYRPVLLRYIRRIGCNDPHAAEDILQEVFISTYRNINSYDPALTFSSWIYRIAHNKTISHFRSTAVRASVSLDHDEYVSLLPDDTPEQRESLDRSDKALLQKALDALPEQYREVLVLCYLEEKSYDAIADILEKPPGTIATLIHRAKKLLRSEFEKQPYEHIR